jgi:peroxiredoxin
MDGIQDAAQMATLIGAGFPILADPEGRVVRRYGVYNLLGDEVAAPATFIIGRKSTILWRHIGRDFADRPGAEEVLAVLKDM